MARVRKAADNPEMTAVIVQLGPNTRTRPKDFQSDYAGLREAQRQFVISDGNALLVPALGKALKDGVHLATAGYEELGREIASAILRNRFGRTDVDWPGPVMDAAVVDDSGQRLVVHFAEVRKLDGVTPVDFAVSDGAGESVCHSARTGSTTIELLFDRKITLPAYVTYGRGNGPQATLVDEAGNHAPAVRMPVSSGPVPADEFTSSPSGAGKSGEMGGSSPVFAGNSIRS